MIGDTIYTEKELCLISGHQTRDGLSSWLKQHGISFVTAKNGWPRVHVKALEAAMGVRGAEQVGAAPVQFNFEALR